MVTKICFKCGFDKPINDFYKHPQMSDGRLNKCKACTKTDVSKNYLVNVDQYKEYEKKREKDPERKKSKITYQRTTRLNNPEKYQATTMVNNAIRDGRLFKKPCEVCDNLDVHAHHEDYSKPLEVRWLCKDHHMHEHDKNLYLD